jgi:hypothetical protein
MRIFSLFISFLIFFCSAADSVSANEAMLQSIQKSMQELQKTVQTLQTTVASQNEIIERQTIRINALEDSKVAAQAGQTTVALPGGDKPLAGISQGLIPKSEWWAARR